MPWGSETDYGFGTPTNQPGPGTTTTPVVLNFADPYLEFLGTESNAVRSYLQEIAGDLFLVSNAVYNPTLATWSCVNAAVAAYAYWFKQSTGVWSRVKHAATAGTWANAAWTVLDSIDASGNVTVAGDLTVTGAVINNIILPVTAGDTAVLLAASQALTNKTLTAPVINGTITGTYTLGGTPTIAANTAIASPVLSGTATGTYTLGGTPTISSPTITGANLEGTTLLGNDLANYASLVGVAGASGSVVIPWTLTGAATSVGLNIVPKGAGQLQVGGVAVALTPTIVLKSGTQNGTNYTTGTATYTDIDTTNLGYTVTIPTGYKLRVWATFNGQTPSAVSGFVRVVDGTTAIMETTLPTGTTNCTWGQAASVTGDGASHTIKMQYATGSAGNNLTAWNKAPSSSTTPANGWCSLLFCLEPAS